MTGTEVGLFFKDIRNGSGVVYVYDSCYGMFGEIAGTSSVPKYAHCCESITNVGESLH